MNSLNESRLVGGSWKLMVGVRCVFGVRSIPLVDMFGYVGGM